MDHRVVRGVGSRPIEDYEFTTSVSMMTSVSVLCLAQWTSVIYHYCVIGRITVVNKIFEILTFLIFTISDKLDAFTYVGNLANVDFISMNK